VKYARHRKINGLIYTSTLKSQTQKSRVEWWLPEAGGAGEVQRYWSNGTVGYFSYEEE
jgi:hypothetical protein